MSTKSNRNPKGLSKKQVVNANEVSKSENAQILGENAAEVILKDKDALAQDAAIKAAKKAERAYNRVVSGIISDTKHKVLSPVAWLKTAKAVAAECEPAIAKAIDSKWATLCVEVKKAGAYYAESVNVIDKKSGEKVTAMQYHMVYWRPATKVAEIGRKITPTEYRFSIGEKAVEIKSVKDLTVNHEVIECEKVEKVIDGVNWTRKIERKVQKDFRPVEILDLTPSEFATRFKLAMQVVFPNNTFC